MGLAEVYDFYWNENVDPRTKNWPLMASPLIIPLSLVAYVYIVLIFGPRYMKNRQPYNLETFRKCYNIFQISYNSFLVYEFLQAGWFTSVSPFCELPNYTDEPGPMRIARTMWFATILKYIDLVETIVFVLRKKQNQISFLRVYHHISTLLIAWLCTRHVAVALASFPVFINSGVHVVMYVYYHLSTMGPETRKIVNKFKPAITIMQMAQFIVLILHAVQTLMPHCPVSRIPGTTLTINLIINFVLFYNFYQQQYVKKAARKEK